MLYILLIHSDNKNQADDGVQNVAGTTPGDKTDPYTAGFNKKLNVYVK